MTSPFLTSNKRFDLVYKLGDFITECEDSLYHKATRISDQKVVAVKISKDKQIFETRNEAELSYALKNYSQYIEEIIDYIEDIQENDKHTVYLIYEYFEGGELFDHIVNESFRSEKEKRAVMFQILKSVEACHNEDIIHRNIKPESIYLTSKDLNNTKFKLGRFSMAQRSRSNLLTSQVSIPGYVAPEIIRKSPYADMWSVGVVAFVLLAGYPPFYNDNQKDLFKLIIKGTYEFHEDSWKDISEDAKQFIRELLIVDSSKRMTIKQAIQHPWFGYTPLYLMATKGNQSIILSEIDKDPDSVDQFSEDGRSVLHGVMKSTVSIQEKIELIIHFLKFSKNKTGLLNSSTKEGYTPLHFACENGDSYIDIINLLIENGSDVTKHGDNGITSLHKAAEIGSILIVKRLIEASCPVHIIGSAGVSCLHLAAKHGSLDIAKILLEKDATLINKVLSEGDKTPLYSAIESGSIEMVQYIIQQGGNVNINSNISDTPLQFAAKQNSLDIMKIIVEMGANINAVNKNGFSALHFSASVGNYKAVDYLIENGVVVDCKGYKSLEKGDTVRLNSFGKTTEECKLIQSRWGDYEDDFIGQEGTVVGLKGAVILQFADGKSRGWDPFFVQSEPITPLYMAAENGHFEIVQFLHKKGASLVTLAQVYDKKNEPYCLFGSSSLHYAAKGGNITTVRYLLECKDIDASLEDPNGQVALELAVSPEIWIILLTSFIEGIGDIYRKNKENKNIIDCFVDDDAKVDYFLKSNFSKESLLARNRTLWFYLIQCNGIESKLIEYAQLYPELADAKDYAGRSVIGMATVSNKIAIQSVFLWHGRFRAENTPEHQSKTCFVFKAIDENEFDEAGNPKQVALKLMRKKSQFIREVMVRSSRNFKDEYVVSVLHTFPLLLLDEKVSVDEISTSEDIIIEVDVATKSTNGNNILTKQTAEQFYCVVMPLASRNLFVALKQDRFAGQDMVEVCHVFTQILKCVEHMHLQGVLHADIKTLNIIRTGIYWNLIDFDASCLIGIEPVGLKSSTAYVPPEMIFVHEEKDIVIIKSKENLEPLDKDIDSKDSFDLLIAHPSFDIWSLGCILYQLCSPGIHPLFQGDRDDNLSNNKDDDDNLWQLAKWSEELKAKKLNKIVDPFAKNLISQMLSKDPLKRPTISRILSSHPFISKKQSVRMVGDAAGFDVFISYRVGSDFSHAELFYNILTSKGLRVWWDKKCLSPGVPWKEGFCAGLVNSRAFVCLLSRNAINHPTIERQNFGKLVESSPADNVLLEHRLALELRSLGLIEKVFPVFIGDYDVEMNSYGEFFQAGCLPRCPAVSIDSVESDLRLHLNTQGLGTPLKTDCSVADILNEITECQGAKIEGNKEIAFEAATESIIAMVTDCTKEKESVSNNNKEVSILNKDLKNDLTRPVSASTSKSSEVYRLIIKSKDEEINKLKKELNKIKQLNN